MYDITIIGAGVAGMTATIYARRANKKVLILEGKAYGGQILETEKIENYPATPHISGQNLAKTIYEQMKEFAPDFRYETATKIEKIDGGYTVETDENKYETKTIIIATGTSYRQLGLPNEKELTGKGISYCATCDGKIYENKEIAVVGGGNSALYSSLYLSNLAKKVTIIHRRNEFRGDTALLEKLKERTNIVFKLDKTITELKSENDHLSSIALKTTDSNETEELDISALFVEIGREPNNAIVKELVELDENGYIIADESGKTSNESIFAAGDCRTKTLRQVITASSDGASAANSAISYLNSR